MRRAQAGQGGHSASRHAPDAETSRIELRHFAQGCHHFIDFVDHLPDDRPALRGLDEGFLEALAVAGQIDRASAESSPHPAQISTGIELFMDGPAMNPKHHRNHASGLPIGMDDEGGYL